MQATKSQDVTQLGRQERPRLKDRESLRNELVLPARCLVFVRRDMAEEISAIVYDHEVDVLKEVHGEGAVRIEDDPLKYNILIGSPELIADTTVKMQAAIKERKKVPVLYYYTTHAMERLDDGTWVPVPLIVGEEMERLRTAYGRHQEKPEFAVDVAYPHEGLFIEACGGVFKEWVKHAA